MSGQETYYKNTIDTLEANGLARHLRQSERLLDAAITQDNDNLISFSCNDYLGLSQHPDVIASAIEAAKAYGVGSGASRLITGNHSYYDILEKALASYKHTETALVFGSGYLTNIGLIPALVGKGDLIVADRLIHACMIDGAKLSGARLMRFHHNDVESCAATLEKYRQQFTRCLILTETVFSMDGDVAPIKELDELAQTYDAQLLTDDAHGLGIIPPLQHLSDRVIQMGTLSKAIGGYGGYVCGSEALRQFLIQHARSLIYSTALPPMVVAANHAALQIMQTQPTLAEQAKAHAQYFAQALDLLNPQSTIIPLILGEAEQAVACSLWLREQGFLVSAIRPPTVPNGSSRLRVTFSASHTQEQVKALIKAIKSSSFLSKTHL